jgi:phosphoserine phosphatase
LKKSFAYSDSINDLPLLVSVGFPNIVNPNKALTLIANKNRWPIIAA